MRPIVDRLRRLPCYLAVILLITFGSALSAEAQGGHSSQPTSIGQPNVLGRGAAADDLAFRVATAPIAGFGSEHLPRVDEPSAWNGPDHTDDDLAALTRHVPPEASEMRAIPFGTLEDRLIHLAPASMSLVGSMSGVSSAPPGRMMGRIVRSPDGKLAATLAFNAPTVSVAPYHAAYRNIAQGSATLTYTTPAYYSRDQARSVTLMYSSGQAKPTGFVQVDVTDNSSTTPSMMSIRVKRVDTGTWMTLTNGLTELYYVAGSGANRLAAQFDASALTTAAHSFDVVIRSHWPGGVFTEASPVRVRIPIINERSSRYGRGWSVVGLQRLIDQGDGVFITHGDGTGVWFSGTKTTGYTAPAGEFSTITYNGVGWNRTLTDGTILTFGMSGYLDAAQNRFGEVTYYGYDVSVTPHRLSAIQDPEGKQYTFGYASASALSWIRDPGNRQTNTTVSGALITQLKDPANGIVFDIAYSSDRVTDYWTRGIARSTGSTTAWHYDYDLHGSVSALTAPQVTTTDAGNTRPKTQFVSLEAAVLPVAGKGSSSNPATRVVPANVRVTVTSPRGNSTNSAVDRFGLPTRIEAPLGRTTIIARDTHGRVTQVTSPSGHVAKSVYTGANLTRSIDVTLADTVNYSYGVHSALQRVWGTNTPETYHFLNSVGLPDSTRIGGPGKPATRYEWLKPPTSYWRLRQVTDTEGRFTRYGAGTDGNTAYLYLGTGTATSLTISYGLDALGRRVSSRAQGQLRDSTVYNAMNQVTKQIPTGGGTTNNIYDGTGALDQVTDPKGVVYSVDRNNLGWIVNDQGPGGWRYYGRDRDGNPTYFVNRRNQSITTSYDAAGRPLARSTSDGLTTSWAYGTGSQVDRWERVVHGTLRDSLAFDVAGRLVRTVATRGSNSFTQVYRYNKAGQRDSLWVSGPSGVGPWTTRWRYNALQQLDTIIDRAGQKTRMAYNTDGLLTARHLPNGHSLTNTYAPSYRPATVFRNVISDSLSVSYQESGPWIWERSRFRSYGIIESKNIRQYSYTSGRLAGYQDREENRDCSSGTCYYSTISLGGPSYGYDLAGNRTPGTVQSGTNRLTSAEGFTMTYDADGNLTHKYKTGFDQVLVWNSLGQLTQTTTNGVVRSFVYDGMGRMAQRNWGTGYLDYLYDADHILLESESSGLVTEYTYYPGTDRPHSIRRGSTVHYYMTDEPGDVVALLAQNGAITNRYTYGPWGTRSSASEGTPNALQFQARLFDATSGLYYFRARWYDRDVGRFISEDPLGLAGGINPYVFAANNPANLRDPSGLSPDCSPYFMTPDCYAGMLDGVTAYGRREYGQAGPLSGDEVCRFYGICGVVPRGTGTMSASAPTAGAAGGTAATATQVEAPADWGPCGVSAAGLILSAGGDALFLSGAGLAFKGARLYLAGRTARQLVADRTIRVGRGRTLRQANWMVGGGRGMMIAGTGQIGADWAIGLETSAFIDVGSGGSGWGLVPFVGTGIAAYEFSQACGSALDSLLR